MRKRHNISILAVVVVALTAALGTARAQDSSSQPVPGNAQDSSQQQQPTAPPETPPSPAYGQDNAEPNKTAPISENPRFQRWINPLWAPTLRL